MIFTYLLRSTQNFLKLPQKINHGVNRDDIKKFVKKERDSYHLVAVMVGCIDYVFYLVWLDREFFS